MNAIKNCPITQEDIKIAEAAYGPDIGKIKGKILHDKPQSAAQDLIDIPIELITRHQDIILCIDTVFIKPIVHAVRTIGAGALVIHCKPTTHVQVTHGCTFRNQTAVEAARLYHPGPDIPNVGNL